MRVINKQRRPADHIRRDRLIKITKRAEKAARRQVLDELCSKIVNEKNRSDNGRADFKSKTVGAVATMAGTNGSGCGHDCT